MSQRSSTRLRSFALRRARASRSHRRVSSNGSASVFPPALRCSGSGCLTPTRRTAPRRRGSFRSSRSTTGAGSGDAAPRCVASSRGLRTVCCTRNRVAPAGSSHGARWLCSKKASESIGMRCQSCARCLPRCSASRMWCSTRRVITGASKRKVHQWYVRIMKAIAT